MVKNVLVISHDKVGPLMAGPGMRYHQIATELSRQFTVTLATFNPEHANPVPGAPYTLTSIKTYDFKDDFDQFDAIVAMSLSGDMIEYAKQEGIRLIFDLYAPVPVEDLIAKVFAGKTGQEEAYNYSVMLSHYQEILRNGDFFLCSNPIQKDYWLGFAMSGGATSPVTYGKFPLFDRITELPMGINLDELKEPHNLNLLSERIPSIKSDDFVLLWTGGIWDWFDATTPIEAVAKVVEAGHKNVKLVFLGTRHPNPDVPEMGETEKAYKRAKELGLLGSNVFFLEGWVNYQDRLSYLLRANVAVYGHKPSVEARYSHRTRVLDHFLADLPSIVTDGDFLGDVIKEERFGITVEPENVETFADAITTMLTDKKLYSEIKANINSKQASFTWSESCKGLVTYLKSDTPIRETTLLPSPNAIPQKSIVVTVGKKILPRPVKERLKRFLVR